MSALMPWKSKRMELFGDGHRDTGLRDFPNLLRKMQSEFEELMQRFVRDLPAPTGGNGWKWGVEMEEKDDCILIRAEAPGFEAGDFDLQVSGNRLTLKAAHKVDKKEKKSEYHESRECYESMLLPTGIDMEKIDARYHSGVLTLTIPKTADYKSKKIAVKAS